MKTRVTTAGVAILVLGIARFSGVSLAAMADAAGRPSEEQGYGAAPRESERSAATSAEGMTEDANASAAERTTPTAELPVLLRQASEYERSLLEDGVVTRDELLGAFQAANSCIESAAAGAGSVTVHEPDLRGDEPRFGGFSSQDKASFDAVGEAELDCVEEFYNHVLAGWGMRSAYAAAQPLLAATADCLAMRGYAVAPGATRVELALAVGNPGTPIPDFYACEAEAIAKLGR